MSFKIQKPGYSEAVNRKGTDNKMVKNYTENCICMLFDEHLSFAFVLLILILQYIVPLNFHYISILLVVASDEDSIVEIYI